MYVMLPRLSWIGHFDLSCPLRHRILMLTIFTPSILGRPRRIEWVLAMIFAVRYEQNQKVDVACASRKRSTAL